MSIFPHPHKELYEAVKALLWHQIANAANREDSYQWRRLYEAVESAKQRDEAGIKKLLADIVKPERCGELLISYGDVARCIVESGTEHSHHDMTVDEAVAAGKAERVWRCEGCDDWHTTVKSRAIVNVGTGEPDTARYCDGCFEIARQNFPSSFGS